MRNKNDQRKQQQFAHLLKHILHPCDRIQSRLFPTIREVTEGIEMSLGTHVELTPFPM